MSSIKKPLCYSCDIYFRIVGTYKEKPNKESCFMGFTEKREFLIRRENRFKHEIAPFIKTLVP